MTVAFRSLLGAAGRTETPVSAGPDGTQNYVEYTIAASQVGSTLTDYPAYLRMSDLPAAFWTGVQSDGGDIRVTQSDGTTRCPVDLVSIDTGGSTGELHFGTSSVSSSSDTTFRIYYNATSTQSQPAVGDTYGRNAVWGDYIFTHHLGDADGAAPQFTDAAGNYDGTARNMASGAFQATGQIGGAVDLDGTNDYVDLGEFPAHSIGNGFTLSVWKKATTGNGIIIAMDDSDSERVFQLTQNSVNGWAHLIRFDASESVAASFAGVTDVNDDAFHLIHVTFDTTGGSVIYVDGSEDSSDAGTTANNDTDGGDLLLGARKAEGSPASFHEGLLDEARFRAGALSAAWIAAEHTNQNAPTTFYTIGSEQAA